MLKALAVKNYRSLHSIVLPLGQLNVITGANGSGKSNLYRALRLLAVTAQGGVVRSLASEGGLPSTFWAGPETISRRMLTGEVPVQGGPRQDSYRLNLGFSGDDYGYAISLGVSTSTPSAFALDPQIKREVIWAGGAWSQSRTIVDRTGPVVKVRDGRKWQIVHQHLHGGDSMFSQVSDARATPELVALRDKIRDWRFYDYFRTDENAPARAAQLGTLTPILSHDGRDIAAALQTIREIGDGEALAESIDDAFPGARLAIDQHADGRFSIDLQQPGLLRGLSGAELSDGTLRYLLLLGALLSPRPPELMVLNEPETSLHPDLLPALSRLIIRASRTSQVWVVSHASRLVNALNQAADCNSLELEKELSETRVSGLGMLDEPSWKWPE